jgi:hypothetical protein
LNPKTQQLFTELNEQLAFIELENDNIIKSCESAIEIICKSLQKLRVLFNKEKIKSQNQEIHFFKNIKPKFTSKLIYYNLIYKIETKMPHGGEKIVKKYLNNELLKLKLFFDNNLDFYRYYRTGNSYLDHKYFVRGNFDIKLSLDSFCFEVDKDFSTSHDFKVAEILAHDLIQVYLESKLLRIENKDNSEKSQRRPNFKLVWTSSKVALNELLYALHSEGVFNNGTADLKDIAEYFEDIFEIELGQYRRTFLEIRARKNDQTKFITSLNDSLIKRINNSDDMI